MGTERNKSEFSESIPRSYISANIMNAPILYCGDTNLDGAASYLAGLMTHFGWDFEYIPSHAPMTTETITRKHSLLILSDYPASQFDESLQEIAIRQVESGMGLLMIGGWESFRGFGGDWDVTPLGRILPVEISRNDDRVNFSQPTILVTPEEQHINSCDPNEFGNKDLSGRNSRLAITAGLPWRQSPPTTGGLNRVNFRSSQQTHPLLYAKSFSLKWNQETVNWEANEEANYPALVVGDHQMGRTAAFMSDVAPHWVGGFVDWGPDRVKAQATSAAAIEVGSYYSQFWKQLLSWVGRLA